MVKQENTKMVKTYQEPLPVDDARAARLAARAAQYKAWRVEGERRRLAAKGCAVVKAKPININCMDKYIPKQFDIPPENVKAHKLSMDGIFVKGMKRPNPNKKKIKKDSVS